VQVGDTFLLCSDGLTGRVSDAELGAILAHLPPKEAGAALVDLANLRGGPDNITLIVVKVTDPQITTAVAQTEPLVLGAVMEKEKTVHPALWVTIGVLFLAAIVMIVLDFRVMGLAAGCAGILAATVGILQRFGSLDFFGSKEVSLAGGRRLGGGPYTETKVVTGPPLVDEMKDVIDKLHEGIQQRGRELDWASIQRSAEQAIATGRSDLTRSMRHFAAALHEMIQQLRQKQKAATSDSNAELF
jgi:protein phosphatase